MRALVEIKIMSAYIEGSVKETSSDTVWCFLLGKFKPAGKQRTDLWRWWTHPTCLFSVSVLCVINDFLRVSKRFWTTFRERSPSVKVGWCPGNWLTCGGPVRPWTDCLSTWGHLQHALSSLLKHDSKQLSFIAHLDATEQHYNSFVLQVNVANFSCSSTIRCPKQEGLKVATFCP